MSRGELRAAYMFVISGDGFFQEQAPISLQDFRNIQQNLGCARFKLSHT